MGALINSGIGAYEATSNAVKTSFDLLHKGSPIFERYFDGQSSTIVDIENNRVSLKNHNFVTGEEVEYNYDYDFLHEPIRIEETDVPGIGITDILPSKLYIVKEDDLHVRFAASPSNANVEFPTVFNISSVGVGTLHRISSKNVESRTLFAIDNIIQSPIVGTGITSLLIENVNTITDIIGVSTTTNLYNGDIIRINDEIMEVRTVGFSSANYLLVRRPVVGTNLGVHTAGDIVEKLSGNYTITDSTVNFTSAPFGIRPVGLGTTVGSSFNDSDYIGINTSSKFSGRCFIRSGVPGDTQKSYYDNYVFDDISEGFTGVSSEFYLKVNNENISNFDLDSTMLLVRNTFQNPKVSYNNFNSGNYEINAGVSSVGLNFIGLKPFSPEDVNSSGVPVGGVISSIGSSEGFGYQKLKTAGLSATLSPSGSIQSIQINDPGFGYRPNVQNPINVYAKTGNFQNQKIEKIGEAVVGADIETRGRIVSVNITNFGSGYSEENSPEIVIDNPLNYTNIPLVYSVDSQPGVGTGAKIDVTVGQGSNIISFEIKDYGYGYKPGDILTLPFGYEEGIEGLVDYDYNILTTNQSINPGITTTFDGPVVVDDGVLVYIDDTGTLIVGDNKYISILQQFQIYVDAVYKDNFSAWSFGELEVFDSPENLFNGIRKTFPLRVNGIPKSIIGDGRLDLQSALIVFINGILQVPGEGYTFTGGSTITFTEAPNGSLPGTVNTGDTCQIIFYRGTENVDVINVDILETIKRGDIVKLLGEESTLREEDRLVHDITSTTRILTNLYAGVGIITDSSIQRSLYWSKQTEDLFIDGLEVTKDRPLYEPKIYPVTNIIQNVGTALSTSIYVEAVKASFDNYREDSDGDVFKDIEIIDQAEKIRAKATANISSGSVSSFIISDSGFGYEPGSNPTVSISSPIGIGSTGRAQAYGNVNSSGRIASITITNAGFGYTSAPDVLIEQPTGKREKISNVSYIGDYGVVTGIATTSVGVGSTGLTFNLYVPERSSIRDQSITGIAITASQLQQGDYFAIKNSYVGEGIISLDLEGNVIGIASTGIDNVYQVYSTSYDSKTFDTTETISGFQVFNSPGMIDEGITITVDDDSILVIDNYSTTNVTVRVAEVYPSISTLAPTLFYADYTWGKIQTTSRRTPTEFEAYVQNGVSGINTSAYVRRINPLNYFDYIS